MADVVSLPTKRRYQDPTGCITITCSNEGDAFEVRAYFGGLPSDPETSLIYCGFRTTLRDAAELAREKARDLGVSEIADLTSVEPTPDGAA